MDDSGFYWFYFLNNLVAVGMLVARHPPHRSVREALPHTAPALGNDAKTN